MLGVFTFLFLFNIILVASCIEGLNPATIIENLNGECSNVAGIKSGKEFLSSNNSVKSAAKHAPVAKSRSV